ncbi:unnamed protein product [marine sediment metagenome]|uniref:4Fe4S-binding SPASM domain-containing protein n=1 Tax=marine sediment metagenome TaxID=412755 RepID=X0TB72_9ZZZZ
MWTSMPGRICIFPWRDVLIRTNGDVLFCCHMGKPLGNLREKSFREIWNSPLAQEIRECIVRGQLSSVCRTPSCPVREVMGGKNVSGQFDTIK